MANIKSAVKRVEIAERNRSYNRAYKSAVKTLMKKCLGAVDSYLAKPSPELAQEVRSVLSDAYSKIDKAVKRGVIHRNNGARKKSLLARAVKRTEAPWTQAA